MLSHASAPSTSARDKPSTDKQDKNMSSMQLGEYDNRKDAPSANRQPKAAFHLLCGISTAVPKKQRKVSYDILYAAWMCYLGRLHLNCCCEAAVRPRSHRIGEKCVLTVDSKRDSFEKIYFSSLLHPNRRDLPWDKSPVKCGGFHRDLSTCTSTQQL